MRSEEFVKSVCEIIGPSRSARRHGRWKDKSVGVHIRERCIGKIESRNA